MTAQAPDIVFYKRKRYELIGCEGGELITPQQFGMEPKMLHTACYRGFIATYRIRRNILYLSEMILRETNDRYVPINGIQPELEDYCAKYCKLNMVVNFTGNIRLARDFIEDFYIHMGFQKATAFGTVLDITLQDGKIVTVHDRSEEISKKQGEFKKRYESSKLLDKLHDAFNPDMDIE